MARLQMAVFRNVLFGKTNRRLGPLVLHNDSQSSEFSAVVCAGSRIRVNPGNRRGEQARESIAVVGRFVAQRLSPREAAQGTCLRGQTC